MLSIERVDGIRIARLVFVCLGLGCVGLPTANCGDTETPSRETIDGDGEEVIDVDDATDIASDMSEVQQQALCSKISDRLGACGLSTSFPDFESLCATFGTEKIAILDACQIKPCAGLFECAKIVVAE